MLPSHRNELTLRRWARGSVRPKRCESSADPSLCRTSSAAGWKRGHRPGGVVRAPEAERSRIVSGGSRAPHVEQGDCCGSSGPVPEQGRSLPRPFVFSVTSERRALPKVRPAWSDSRRHPHTKKQCRQLRSFDGGRCSTTQASIRASSVHTPGNVPAVGGTASDHELDRAESRGVACPRLQAAPDSRLSSSAVRRQAL